ncbi:DUF4349 domain-containing protein [Cellulomonas sp. DKR-3]|uniref:DUF4349 domain-containing protein n=1 Tax=Cellulomonas fulva TaxID=2835530 RepID=A0ABS5TZI0_9CELL|nr:DUF4349 domain-containing protein [Cellulomonas fulva]MBT0994520.1 DUF4349 domain-containing protein [Cellulomonas fulva]
MTRGTRTRQAAWAAPVLALLLVLAGCSDGGDAAESADGGSGGSVAGPQDGGDAGGDSDAAAVSEGGGVDEAERQVIQTGSIRMTVEDPQVVTDQVVDLVEGKGGRVDSRSESAASTDETAQSSLTVRVPADQVSSTVDALRELGEVDGIDLQAQDVTGTAQDLDARIHALELSVDRMEQLMTDATSTRDLLAAESALSERQASLEQLQSERARLADKVALSTLEISIAGPGALPVQAEEEDGTFLTGLENGWEALVATIGVLMVVLGAVLPWLAVAALVGLVWLAVRRRRRRRAAPAPQEQPVPATVGTAPAASSDASSD